MRKNKGIKAGFRLCAIIILHGLFFVTQLISVNPFFQHASIFVFTQSVPQELKAKKLVDATGFQQESKNAGLRLNKKFSNTDFFELAPEPGNSPLLQYHIKTTSFLVRQTSEEPAAEKQLRGPPAA